jgi:predicted unusual protein kinase regulating ubiquinone biosynthesis (AarF/ABC1/UbiB family)
MELLADDVLAELYDWPIVLPSNLVYFARTAALIEGLGTHYDPHFNALAFAAPIALSLRSRILASLYPDGARPVLDPARAIGSAIGAVVRILRRTGEDLLGAVRDAVAQATLPTAESLDAANGDVVAANTLPDRVRTTDE